jgi:hypothetical protein
LLLATLREALAEPGPLFLGHVLELLAILRPLGGFLQGLELGDTGFEVGHRLLLGLAHPLEGLLARGIVLLGDRGIGNGQNHGTDTDGKSVLFHLTSPFVGDGENDLPPLFQPMEPEEVYSNPEF